MHLIQTLSEPIKMLRKIKQKKIFKFFSKPTFQFNQIFSQEDFNKEAQTVQKVEEKLVEEKKIPTKNLWPQMVEKLKEQLISKSLSIFFAIVGIMVTIVLYLINQWTPKGYFYLSLFSREYEPLRMPKYYFPRNKIEKNIEDLLNKSQLIIVYGPKTSGKSTTVNHVLKRRKGVIHVIYQKETNLINELGKQLKIPIEMLSLSTIETVFQEFKKVYGYYPVVNVEVNGQYHISMEQWVRDGRHLTESGKGFCDCIIQFSDEDASLAGLVERSRSKYIKFGDLSKEEAINYLNTFTQPEPEKILDELKTTRVGALEQVVDGSKANFLHDRDVGLEFIFKNQKYVEILREIDEGKLKKVVDIMEKLGYDETKEKEFFQHPLFTKKALIVDIEEFTVSLDSEFIQEKIKNFKN